MNEFIKIIISDFWATFAEMSPYLLFGFLVAGILSVFISQGFVERHLGGRGFLELFKASVIGVPLPLCSCGVIPVSMSLYKHGASKGSTIAFLLSTPQTGVDSIFVTLSLLGPVFAIFRPLAALATGIFSGGMVNLFADTKNNTEKAPEKCTDECCGGSEKNNHKIKRALKYGFVTLPRDIGRAMLVGLVIAAFISALIPDGFFAEKLGRGIFPMIIMMFLGIPVYVCATASVPVAAALMLKGLSPGAALVFLMTGPATNAASFVTIWKMLGKATAITYLAAVAISAILCGLLLDQIAIWFEFEVFSKTHCMPSEVMQNISAVLLLAILTSAIITGKKNKGN